MGVPPSSVDGYGQQLSESGAPTVALPSEPAGYFPRPGEVIAPQQESAAVPDAAASGAAGAPTKRHSRTGAAWVALVVAAVVFVFLLIFIVQNSGPVQVRYFGFEGTMSLGVAMMFAAVAGALTAGLLGTVRILQLRSRARRARAGR